MVILKQNGERIDLHIALQKIENKTERLSVSKAVHTNSTQLRQFMTAWLLPDYCLITAWRLPRHFLEAANVIAILN